MGGPGLFVLGSHPWKQLGAGGAEPVSAAVVSLQQSPTSLLELGRKGHGEQERGEGREKGGGEKEEREDRGGRSGVWRDTLHVTVEG